MLQFQDLVQLNLTGKAPELWPAKSLAIYCGPSAETWDGESVEKGGIGGSETAVIEIGTRLAKRGWKVVVFNRCASLSKMVDGVEYRKYWQINIHDQFDVIWLWRSPVFLDIQWKARKVVFDLHDVWPDTDFTQERVARCDQIMVKSTFHQSLFPSLPSNKTLVVGNGIDIRRFDGAQARDRHRFVYSSGPVRGLEALLQMWPTIKKNIPQAELHVYYGWISFAEEHKNNPDVISWISMMKNLIKQDGITDHGRVSQDRLAAELLQSSVWLYPTNFIEIHCITALEMQAAGVIPVTTGFAALNETQKSGRKLPGNPYDKAWQDRYIDAVVETYSTLSTDEAEKERLRGYHFVEDCTWDQVAAQWDKIAAATSCGGT